MSEVIKNLKHSGYTKNFVIRNGQLHIEDRSYLPNQVSIDATKRIEDDSDPNNQSIVYGVRSLDGKFKGLVINGFGLNSDLDKDSFILNVRKSHQSST